MMALAPYVISGYVYELVTGSGTAYQNAKVYVYNVTNGNYIHATSNVSGQYQIDLADQTVATNTDGYTIGDKLQLYFIDADGNRSICYRHTTASGDGGAWSKNGYLHNTKVITFRENSSSLAEIIPGCVVSGIVVSNRMPASRSIWLYDRTYDNPIARVECPSDDTISINFGTDGLYFDGGICVDYEIDTNDSSGHNDLECTIVYGKRGV